MEDPIVVSYDFTDAEMRRLFTLAIRSRLIARFSMPIGLTIVGVILLRLWFTSFEYFGDYFAPLVFGAFFVCLVPITKWISLRRFRKSPLRGMSAVWTITPERLSSRGGDAYSNDFSWKMITRVVEVRDGFMLYPNTSQIYWLPFDGFRHQADIGGFRELASTRVPKYEIKA